MKNNDSDVIVSPKDFHFTEIDERLFVVVGPKLAENEKIMTKSYGYWKIVAKYLLVKKTFLVSLFLLLLIVLLAIIVPINKVANPLPEDLPIPGFQHPAKPSWHHLFGLGMAGEDYWNKIWIGMQNTLIFTLIIVAIKIMLGLVIGSIWGFYRKTDIFFIELTRFLSLVPTLILWLIVIFVLGKSFVVIVLAVSITSWISLAEIIRVQIMLVKNTEYNLASKMLGTSGPKIVLKNIMPRILPLIIQTISFAVPTAIAIDSTLNYFNFGFVSNRAATTLGFILNEVLVTTQWQDYPHLLLIPVSFIAGTSFLFFLFGKVIADSLDPKNHYK